jgi:hypothetical protein
VTDRLQAWRLDYPVDPGALKERLDAGIPARTLLWLGELRQYADVDGGVAALSRLADLLVGKGHLVITTMWPEHWNAYIAAARAGLGLADPAGPVGRLLERLPELTGSDPARVDPARGGVIDVPDRFTAAEIEQARTSGQVLADAAAAAASAGRNGQVTQYLAGVPELLYRYAGDGGNCYGQAVITAAMDAARLGHASPMPAALLQEAAVGYLTDAERTEDIAIWRDTALAWAVEELNGAVRALQPTPPAAGTGVAGYQVADYLDQYGRRTRQDQLGPASLWDALVAHTTSSSDLTRLAQGARNRGLYRHAAGLWTTAAILGSTDAAGQLVAHLRQASPGAAARAARWAADRTSLDNPYAVASLLEALREAGASDAARALLARDPVGQVSLDNPYAVASLLGELRAAGDSGAAHALAARAAAQVSLDDPGAVSSLLRELRAAGYEFARLRELRAVGPDHDAHYALARRAAHDANLDDDPVGVRELLGELRAAGYKYAARALAARVPADLVRVDDPPAASSFTSVAEAKQRFGGAGDVARAARYAAGHASLDDPRAVAGLLREVRAAGAPDAVRALLARDPAGQVSVGNTWAVVWLLRELRAAGADDAAYYALARRATHDANLDNPIADMAVALLLQELDLTGPHDAARAARWAAELASLDDLRAVAWLLRELREAGDSDAAHALAARAAAHASPHDPFEVAFLLGELREAGDSDAAHALAARAAAHANLDNPIADAELLRELRGAGATDAVGALAARAAAHACPDDPWAVVWLLQELREAGATDAVDTLAARCANAGLFNLFLKAHPDVAPRYLAGREPDGTPSQTWKWQEPTSHNRQSANRQLGAGELLGDVGGTGGEFSSDVSKT